MFKNGGGGGSRTRVQNGQAIRSFTSLDSFSKLTKYPQTLPVSYVALETHLLKQGNHYGLISVGETNHLFVI